MEESLLVSTDYPIRSYIWRSHPNPSLPSPILWTFLHPALPFFGMPGRRAGMYDARHEHAFITLRAYLFLLPRFEEPGVQAVRIVRPTTVDRLTS